MFFLAFGTDEDAGLGAIAPNYPINILDGLAASTLKFLRGQPQEGMPCPFLYLCGALRLIHSRVT
jgi:hypothetical protein